MKWDKVGNSKKPMLIGEFTHTLDDKKRISLPARLRKEIGKKVVLTRGLDNCIFLYPPEQWAQISEELSNLSIGQANSRAFNRFMLAGAVEVEIDSAGRILIPDFLKDFAKLGERVVLAGVYNRIEIWNEDVWTQYKDQIEKDADVLAEKLGDIGAI